MRSLRSTERGGIACGACDISLQEAGFIFGLADMIHGIVGVAVLTTMLIKREADQVDIADAAVNPFFRRERVTGYNVWLAEFPPWILQWILISFIVQIALGILLSLGSAYRNSFACSTWLIISVLTSLSTPATYCLLVLGRLFEFAAILEFVWKMDEEEARQKRLEERGKITFGEMDMD